MSFLHLGCSGLRVSRICLGTMMFGNQNQGCDESTAKQMIDTYLDFGHNFVDTADIYGNGQSEEIVGRALENKRKNTVLATKVFWAVEPGPNNNGLSRKHIISACEDSLRRLKTDYIDLYYVHIWDPVTPLEETMSALNWLVKQGKVRYLGVSDWTGWQVSEGMAMARQNHWSSFVCHQLEYSVLVRDIEVEIAPASRYNKLGLVAWSPLAGGLLSGKYGAAQIPESGTRFSGKAGEWWLQIFGSEENWRASVEFSNVARDMGVSPVSLAVAYSLLPEGMDATIIGPRNPEQLADNLRGEELVIPVEFRVRLDALRPPHLPFPHGMQTSAKSLRMKG